MLLKSGMRGYEVSMLQNGLNFLNYCCGSVDGEFGPKTEQAVKLFQETNGLEADGIAGDQTWGALCERIKDVQEHLNSYGAGIIVDGIVGTNTLNALLAFQRANGLLTDGIAGQNTLKTLTSGSGCNIGAYIQSGTYNISDFGINFIADYEDYYAEPYRGLDYENQTIGYGHVIREGEYFTHLSKAEAKQLLYDDMKFYVSEVNRIVAGLELKQHEFDALVSFGYNVGTGEKGLAGSTLLKSIKAGYGSDVIRKEFMKWCYCHKERALGLYRRRNDEANMFLKGIYNRTYINFED